MRSGRGPHGRRVAGHAVQLGKLGRVEVDDVLRRRPVRAFFLAAVASRQIRRRNFRACPVPLRRRCSTRRVRRVVRRIALRRVHRDAGQARRKRGWRDGCAVYHARQVLSRSASRLRVERTADARLDGRCLKAGNVNVFVQLVQDVLAVAGRCYRCALSSTTSCLGTGCLADQIAVFVKGNVGGDEYRYG